VHEGEGGAEREQVQKGRVGDAPPAFIHTEREEEETGKGAAADTLAIDGRWRCGIKKEGKRGNRRIWRRNGCGDYGS
jgi:hypothetical protein